jgi:uncharacterized repeat protein (TIGR01451 family)
VRDTGLPTLLIASNAIRLANFTDLRIRAGLIHSKAWRKVRLTERGRMHPWMRDYCFKLLAASLCLLSGCFGVTQNPSYFPYLLPTGDIIQTHAKPVGAGYYADFDPHAVHLEVRPLESTDPVRTQHVILATIYDEKGQPRRARRVEWMVEGVGNIVEVDESGYFPGRGYKVDNKYAVSYTSYKEHRITRGNANPNDDFVIRPGQTWCVISSAVEGDSHVTVYAPEIANWDAHKVFVTKHWVDAEWCLPAPAVNNVGTIHAISTNIFRHTDRQPLANYRVRYRILDGPPALFLPDRTPEFVAVSNLSGNAVATLVQAAPQPGINRIGIEIIRPPDPTSPSGAGIVIGQGQTTKEWRGTQIALGLTAPPTGVVNQEIPYTITITNNGQVPTQAITVRDPLPEGTQLVRSEPRPSIEGTQLIWTLGTLPPGGTHTIQLGLKAPRPGPVTNTVSMTTVEGLHDEKSMTTQVGAEQVAQLNVAVSDPGAVMLNTPVTLQIAVNNPGSGPATNTLLSASFDTGLEHTTRANPLNSQLGTIGPGETKTVPLTLTPKQVGSFNVRVTATADGGLKSEARKTVNVQNARLTLDVKGPTVLYVGQAVTWDITLANPGDVSLANVIVRNQLPAEVTFLNASALGQVVNGQVVWNLGPLAGRESKTLQVTGRCDRIAARALNTAVASADPGIQEQAQSTLEIRGIPAFALEINKMGDPVAVGGKITYRVNVTNTGSLPANQVEVSAIIPSQLKVTATNGPTTPRTEAGKIVFPALDALQPKQVLSYTIEAQGVQPGDARFRVELRAGSLTDPVTKEESTNVFVPLNGGPPTK